MFRVVAIMLVALATFDLFFLDGKPVHAVEAVARSLAHFISDSQALRRSGILKTGRCTQTALGA